MNSASCSDFSIDVVPTSIGCRFWLASSISWTIAFSFSGAGAIDLVVLVETPDRHVGRNLDHVELVDLGEFVGLGRGGAGHAGELLVEAEIILEGDRGEGDVLRLDGDMFLGFERLMEALRIAPPGHHPAGEFVDDHHLVVADDVILVAMEQCMGLQGLLHVMHDRDIGGIVERALVEEPDAGQQLLHMFVARLGEVDGALLLVEFVIGLDELREAAR